MRNVSFKRVGAACLLILVLDLVLMLGLLTWHAVQLPTDLTDEAFHAELLAFGMSSEVHIASLLIGSFTCAVGAWWTARKSAPGAIKANAVALAVVGLLVSVVVALLTWDDAHPAWFSPLAYASVPIATWLGTLLNVRRARA